MSLENVGLHELTGLPENSAADNGLVLDTGDLRRQYNFGSAELARIDPSQQPYVHILSIFRNVPTDDSEFKFVERRPSFNRRYAYVTEWYDEGTLTWISDNATIPATALAVNTEINLRFSTDYIWSGNIAPRVGHGGAKPGNEANAGSEDTIPKWLLTGTIITIKGFSAATEVDAEAGWQTYNFNGVSGMPGIIPNDFVNIRVTGVNDDDAVGGFYTVTGVVRKAPDNAFFELASFYDAATSMAAPAAHHPNLFPNNSESWGLETKRCYASGNSWAQGSGMPKTWIDQPFSVGTGLTQIVKTKIEFDGTTMATVLKLDPNEYLRVYKEKLFEHQVDKAQAIYWSHQHKEIDATTNKRLQETQGTIDYTLSYGNIFTLDLASKNRDDFQQDLTEYKAVSGANPNELIYFADTVTFNWLFSLGGFWMNNVQISQNYRMLMDITPQGEVALGGVTFTVFGTPVGKIRVAEDPMLNGSPIAMYALPLMDVSYRPLIGNGRNRDTTVYRGVRTIENTGEDIHADLIQTEFGLTHSRPERFAVWKRS